MARHDALLKLHKTLVARRSDIMRKLKDDIEDLRKYKMSESTGDSADVAFESGSDEMTSQLAELDSRELAQIDKALYRLKQGTYGVCEGCSQKIPVGRLNALPYTSLCIECQREIEQYPDWEGKRGTMAWERLFESSSPTEDTREVRLSDLDIDQATSR